MLSTALITVVFGIASSAQQTLIKAEISSSGDWDMCVSDFVQSDIETINNNRDVKATFVKDTLGCAYLPQATSEKRSYININAFSKDALTKCFDTSLQEGRYPENDSELILSQDIIKYSNKTYKLGDKITLELGSRYDIDGNILPDTTEYGLRFGKNGDEYYVDDKAETFKINTTKTYTIVGILNDVNNTTVVADKSLAVCTAITYTDCKSISSNANMYVQFTPDGEKNHVHTVANITGLSDDEVKEYNLHNEETFDDLASKSSYNFNLNDNLLKYKGYSGSEQTMAMIYWLAGIILAIIVIASVFVIRNSFAISITEKTKLYGMIASVGATSKQIRKNVLFEGFMLAIIGIPLGLLLGIGVTSLLIVVLNVLLKESLENIIIVYSIPVMAVIFAVALSAITIFGSTIFSAIRASKIAPITAIRSNNDIKISKKNKKHKRYKSPRLIKKIFGVGGDIAYKNLKRSKKKYRTTVISIIISVAMFVAMSSFMEYGTKFISDSYSSIDYNIMITSNSTDEINAVKNIDGIENSLLLSTASGTFNIDKNKINEKFQTESDIIFISETDESYTLFNDIVVLDDNVYRSVAKSAGINIENDKNQCILYNKYEYTEDGKTNTIKIFNKDSGYTLEGTIGDTDDTDNNSAKIYIAGSVKELPKEFNGVGVYYGTIFVSDNWFVKNTPKVNLKYGLCIQAENADTFEEEVNNLGYSDLDVQNFDALARQMNSLILVFEIFIYGFIIVISLIGITNIFNTITTNMKLRNKEFATLKSIGMTKKEFSRMIRLESLFYGAKSLIIGIPLGILGSYDIFWAFTHRMGYNYEVPWIAILISIVFVFIVVWLIMKFSVSKTNKQNIIETIRKDNI
jgi:putative ABC transport system permease protein